MALAPPSCKRLNWISFPWVSVQRGPRYLLSPRRSCAVLHPIRIHVRCFPQYKVLRSTAYFVLSVIFLSFLVSENQLFCVLEIFTSYFFENTIAFLFNDDCWYLLQCTFSQGDSGCPFVVAVGFGRWVQVGIVSYGIECARPKYPNVYTRVSAYIDWISCNSGGSECDSTCKCCGLSSIP